MFDAQSPIYKTEPQGQVKDQPWFANCVVRLKAASDIWAPEGLLSTLQAVEAQMGRLRGEVVGGPRVIDLDLLMFGDVEMDGEYLTLPHPRMLERAFVLIPLRDIAPNLVFKDGRNIDQVLAGIEYSLDGRAISQK
jgi:2-amino-4-hydroxy-6-hydroxymethyldihydropteridine diphosphokinase